LRIQVAFGYGRAPTLILPFGKIVSEIAPRLLEVRPMTAIDLTGSAEEIRAILAFAKTHPTVEQTSEPTNLDASRALNLGIPNLSPTEVLSFLTLVFTTGKAALDFLKALREQLKIKGSAVAVSESTSGKPLGRLEAGTSDAALAHMAAP